MPLTPGLQAEITLTVAESDTAVALRSGDVPVLATPRIVALCEEATVAAVASHLDPGQTTVGVRVELDHTSASPTGAEVVATAEVVGVRGRAVTFEVSVADRWTGRILASGIVRRIVVDRAEFVDRLGR